MPSGAVVGVGRIDDLAPVGVGVVRCLRLLAAGTDHGAADQAVTYAQAELRAICGLCQAFGSRQVRCHGPGCGVLAPDEALFARLVEAAHVGDRDEAMMMACLLVRADLALQIVRHAEHVGLALARVAAQPFGAGARVH